MENTPFKEIYSNFLSKVKSFTFFEYSDNLPSVLYGYLYSATSDFLIRCRQNIEIENFDDLKEDEFHKNGTYQVKLGMREKEVLAQLMVKHWLSDKLYNEDLMMKDIGDRDYHSQQGSPYLQEIGNLLKATEKRCEGLMVSTTYDEEGIN